MHSRVNSVIAKRVWNYLRIAYFMMRKGLISKRKLIMDINMMMKRGKTLGNRMVHHLHHSRNVSRGGSGLQEYEFSCSNSPNPVFSRAAKSKHHYFPCINPPLTPIDLDDYLSPKTIVVLPKIEYSPEPDYSYSFPTSSPLSVRISNYSSEEDEPEEDNKEIDIDAEEFIKRFYEQLRMQKRSQLLQCQEKMLSLGTHHT